MKQSAVNIIREYGGQIHMNEAIMNGISRYQLYNLWNQGIIEKLTRGIYRLVDMPVMSDPDMVIINLRFPYAVVCLTSALSYYQLTTQIPHEISLAVSPHSRLPTLDSPPVHAYRFSDISFNAGIEKYENDGVSFQIYSPEKTLADCFKFRNKIGMDIVIEAVKLYKSRMTVNIDKLIQYGRICKVENVMTPYLEMII